MTLAGTRVLVVEEAGVTDETEETEGRRFSRCEGERSDSRGEGSANVLPRDAA
jgi:hypothetical protein